MAAGDTYRSNIIIDVNTSQALAEVRALQAALSKFHQALNRGSAVATVGQNKLNAQLISQVNSIKGLSAAQTRIAGTTEAFTSALERNKLSLREYARYSAAGFLEGGLGRTLGKRIKLVNNAFAQERTVLKRAYEDRVKLLQSQWVRLTKPGAGIGADSGIRITPTDLKGLKSGANAMDDLATRTQLAAQRMQLLNATVRQGATQLINWGKNTQWAGRQLMVGLTVPLMILAGVAAKTFKEMEEQTVRFRRVYGNLFTSDAETDAAINNIMRIGKEFAKFGVAVKDTMAMAADAAAAGFSGVALEQQVIQANKLAVLGQIEQQQALETTISLQNAFQISTEDLAGSIDFLNAVENQTVVSLDDITTAIPKVAPVIKQLGGDVKDLAFFLTAMKEGGVNAAQGANALKSGLASLINPSEKAAKMFNEMGINIRGIIQENAGNLKNTVIGVAQALDELDPLQRSQAIEQLFGKFQFARISALFQNIVKDGTQASRVLDLMSASTEELAILSQRELGKVEESVGVQFQKALEELKLELMPLGKLFLETLTPVLGFVRKIVSGFTNLDEGVQKFVFIFAAAFPAVLMALGLFGNLVGNVIKGVWGLNMILAKARNQSNVLGASFNYMTNEELENLSMTRALNTQHTKLIEVFNVEKVAVNQLTAAYRANAVAARQMAALSPGAFVGGARGAAKAKPPKNLNKGTPSVRYYAQGTDTVPAMLTPGEAVIPAQSAQDPANKPFIKAMIAGQRIQQFSKGTAGVNPYINPYSPDTNPRGYEREQRKINQRIGKLNAELEREAKARKEVANQLKNETRERRAAAAGKFAGRASGALGIASMGAFVAGQGGLGMGLMGASLLSNFIPLLLKPQVAIAAAAVAIGASLWGLNKALEIRAKKEAQFITSITANVDQMKKIAAISGRFSASETMAARRAGGGISQTYNEAERVGRQFGSQFLGSEIGKQIFEAFKTNKDIYGTEKAAQDLALQLAAYISDGILSAEQANSIAQQIGINLGNDVITTQIRGELVELVGVNGEDLINRPLTARIKLIQESRGRAELLASDPGFTQLADIVKAEDTLFSVESTARLRKGAAQLAGYAATNAQFAQAQLDSFIIFYEKQIKIKKDALAITKDKEEQLRLNQQILQLQSQQAAGEATLRKEVAAGLSTSLNEFKQVQETAFMLYKNSALSKQEDAYFDALKAKIKDVWKGTDFESAAQRVLDSLAKLSDVNMFTADEFEKAGFKTQTEAQDFEVQMQLLLANRLATPDQIESLMKMFQGRLGQLSANLSIAIETQGAAGVFELQNLLATLGPNASAQRLSRKLFLEISALPTEQFNQTLKALGVMKALDGDEINMRVMLRGLRKNEGLDDFVATLDRIEQMPDVTKKTVEQELVNVGFPPDGAAQIAKEWEYYSKLKPEVRKEAFQKFFAIYQFKTDFQDPEAKLAWRQQYAREQAEAMGAKEGTKQYDYYFTYHFNKTGNMDTAELADLETKTYFGTPVIPDPNKPDGTGEEDKKGRDTTLDNLLNRLKMVRDAAIDAEGGITELLRITSGKGIFKFTGVLQQLQQGVGAFGTKGKFKASRGFLDFVDGLDKATMKKFVTVKNGIVTLTKAGKAANDAFAELPIGEYQESQKRALEGAIAQQKAFIKLRSAGVNYAQALSMIEDESLAVAITQKNITPKELREMAKEANKAKKEIEALNLALMQTAQETRNKTDELTSVLEALQAANSGALQKGLLTQISAQEKIQKNALKETKNAKERKEIQKTLNELENQRLVVTEQFGKLTKEQLAQIASDPGIAKGIQQLLSGAVPSKKIASKIKDIFDSLSGTTINANLQLDIDMQVDPVDAIKKQIGEISTMVSKYFQMRRQQVENQFRSEKRNAEQAVKNAEKLLKTEQSAVDKIQDTIDVIQLEIDKENLRLQIEYDLPIKKLQDAAEILSRQIELGLSREIERLQEISDDLSRSIEMDFERPIQALQEQADAIARIIEIDFERPIGDLQEESSDLANDLELINKAAEEINKKYDAQEKALEQIADINQDIAEQERIRISLADALSQGDISAAAQIAQEAREQAASKAAAADAQKLSIARERELAKLVSKSGMTQLQIEQRQFEIGQLIYNLEEEREKLDLRVRDIQDNIYAIEQQRAIKNKELVVLADKIYDLGEQREAQQLRLRSIEDQIYNLEQARKIQLDLLDAKERQILQIKYEQLIPAQARLDLAQREVDKQREILDGILEAEKEALESLQLQEDAWNDVELAILEAELKMFDFNNALREAIRLAGLLAAALAGAQPATPGAPGTPSAPSTTKPLESGSGAQIGIPKQQLEAELVDVQGKIDDLKNKIKQGGLGPKALENKKNNLADLREEKKSILDDLGSYSTISGGGGAGMMYYMAKGGLIKYMNMGGMVKVPTPEPPPTQAMNMGGMVSYMKNGGMFKPRGTDTVPAMLTPGEFVMTRYAVKNFGLDNMKAINEGTYNNDSVYNYNVNVNVKSDANPDQIARSVIAQIKQIDSQRIRTQRI